MHLGLKTGPLCPKSYTRLKETRLECMYLSNKTLFDVRDMYRICYINNKYMFRPLTVAIFRLIE